MSSEQSGRAGRAWPIVLIVVILTLTTCCVAIMSRRSAEAGVETSADADGLMVLVQHVAFFVMVGLFAWHQRRVLVFLIKLAGRNWVIGSEIMLLLAIVYGAFGSFGVPELFWDDSTITVGVAGFSAMVFLELAWVAIYLVDYARPTRSQHRRLEWNRVEPFVVDSGLPRLLRMPIQDVSPRWQLGWFLAIACLPGLFLLALPAFLPAVRPRAIRESWNGPGWTGPGCGGPTDSPVHQADLILRPPASKRAWQTHGTRPIGCDSPASGRTAVVAGIGLCGGPDR